ncbi:molybdopterin-guanine dinucleotide biosynthesis protein [Arthrobacter sp. ISL-85]|uniref:DUF6457 domain-containing protein n=1 Tax=Arthrobacter sp. ISL-85 TaxID=2819115 RepID=UPI001BEAAE3D|nr:DUF6457 domain-containing protein [Arthrobacter sp. ISL-85]MBT2565222.1 molybdopterin-guanine dinucleotide biosynthesis protein [Arthrobacter sp. ISL-85]
MPSNDEAQVLSQWSQELARALQILDLEVAQELVLDLARKSADSVIHAAAPVTAFMVGYAAGLEAGKGSLGSGVSPALATNRAAEVAFKLCSDWAEGNGWEPTDQS